MGETNELLADVGDTAATDAADAAATDALLAGAGKAEVDLAGVLPFDGFDEVRHPLCARAAVLELGRERACLVSLELTSIAPALLDALREAATAESGCSGANLWVCATHTFSAPHVRTPGHLATNEELEKNESLLKAYAEAVRAAVARAVASLAPARASVGRAASDVNVNRDVETPAGWWLGANPQGFSDRSVRALRLDGADGTPAAVLFSADVQSSVLDGSRTSDGLRLISGDLAGFAAGAVERELGCPALFIEGAAADQAPAEQAVTQIVSPDGVVEKIDAHEQGFRMLHDQGARLASALKEALVGARPIAVDALVVESRELELPGQARGDFHKLAPRHSYEFVLAEAVATTVYALKLGPVTFLGVQPELQSELGHALRAAAPRGAAAPVYVDVLTLVNGAAKYLPCADAYAKITYEAMNSGFAQGAAELLLDDLVNTVARLADRA